GDAGLLRTCAGVGRGSKAIDGTLVIAQIQAVLIFGVRIQALHLKDVPVRGGEGELSFADLLFTPANRSSRGTGLSLRAAERRTDAGPGRLGGKQVGTQQR